jgi:two-component system phosphate regulon sensor histidine kinase PhoR
MSWARAALLVAAAVASVLALAGAPTGVLVVATIALGALALGVEARARGAGPPAAPRRRGRRATDDALAALVGLADPLPDAVLLLDADQIVLAANPAAGELAGRPREELVGASLIRALRHHALVELARTAGSASSEAELDGGQRVRATAVPVAAGAVRGVLVLEDVTELHRAQRARTELVANVSHELRTPITAARALAETLEMELGEASPREMIEPNEMEPAAVEHQARFATRLVEELDRLGGIVDRLLRLSRLESQDEPFAIQALATEAQLRVAAERIAPLATARGVRVHVAAGLQAEPDAPVRADRERLLEVLSNLLENALRVSPDGGSVTLSAHVEGDAVRIEVSDEGPGIPPSERERVFERFYTGDSSRTSGAAGSGLGLAIARHIVLRLGGRIWVDDRHPGATICVDLPRAEGDVAG